MHYFTFLRFNLRILLWTIKIICGKSFKKVDHIDCKIIAFEVKKKTLFTPCKIGSANFEFSWLKTFALQKLEAFDIVLKNRVENPQKQLKCKNLTFHSLNGHQVGGGM
jgi:hypothetical protein